MRRIEYTNQFKRDFKRESKGSNKKALTDLFADIIYTLSDDEVLAEKHRDHALTGEWKDHRDCHIKPNLVLIYRKFDAEVLQLVRLGSHSKLGL